MNPVKARMQRAVFFLRKIPGMNALLVFYYSLAIFFFVLFVRAIRRQRVKSIYLRRGGGRGELVPGASDLDFFLVLETLPAEAEMKFLKTFWRGYHLLRLPFPFLGEVLMGDENELSNWLTTETVRAFESRFSWRRLWGKSCLSAASPPDLRDLFSESLKHYSQILQVALKLRPEQFRSSLHSHEAGAAHLRHGAKAALDLFRLHAVAHGGNSSLWRATRADLIKELSGYGDLSSLGPLLSLRDPLFLSAEPLELFGALIHRAVACLHEMAESLAVRRESGCAGGYHLGYGTPGSPDLYSLSVRELFAERILLRHETISRAILAEATTGLYFTLKSIPNPREVSALLTDLRDVSFSFDRLAVAMPLTDLTFAELERTSLLDTPFHSFSEHREFKRTESRLTTSPYANPAVNIPDSTLRKTFAELSFGLRLQPTELPHFLEKMVALVLSLRLAAEKKEISTNFHRILARYGERYPLRQEQLKAKIHPYLPQAREGEEQVWESLYARLDEFDSAPAQHLRRELEELREKNRQRALSPSLTSDLWINLTPFLRMEMNAMKELFFEQRPALKI